MPDIKFNQRSEQSTVEAGQLKKSLENLAEKVEKKKFETATSRLEAPATEEEAPVMAPASIVSAPAVKLQKQVENVLAEDLTDIYLSLAPPKRQEFKKAGEETAKKISQLLTKAKINIGKIIKLIKKWLALIPGVNKYFLEQEAKIKADELIKLKNGNN